MDAIQKLLAEHRIIERVLSALEVYAVSVEAGMSEERAELLRFVDFIRNFADGNHEVKEERILFARMVENGLPQESGPIALMMREHAEGRALIRELVELSSVRAEWTGEQRRTVAFTAMSLASLIRMHIHKEDHVMFPMALQMLARDTRREVSGAFGRHARENAESEQRLLDLARALEARWPVDRSRAYDASLELRAPAR